MHGNCFHHHRAIGQVLLYLLKYRLIDKRDKNDMQSAKSEGMIGPPQVEDDDLLVPYIKFTAYDF
jgi:hypothetical protein